MAVPRAYLTAVAAASQKYKVPATLLAAQIQAESNWNPNAKSGAGATGISQFMPGTAAGFHIDPKDPFQSIDAQGKMMHNLLVKYKGNQDLALAAYNAGSGAVDSAGGVPNNGETPKYIQNIHKFEANYPGLAAGKYGGSTAPTAVHRAAAYQRVINGVSTAPVSGSKASLGGGGGNTSGGGFDPMQALLQYNLSVSQGHTSSNDLSSLLSGIVTANQQGLQAPNAMTPNPGIISTTGTTGAAKTVTGTTTGVIPSSDGGDPNAKFDFTGYGKVTDLKKQTIVGRPYQGTHRDFGNWESDNAIDITMPVKSPVYAAADGVIGNQIGGSNSKNTHLAGQRVHLVTHGNELYYQHLQSLSVKAGQHVKKGDIIGYSGALNHLHLGVKYGNPEAFA